MSIRPLSYLAAPYTKLNPDGSLDKQAMEERYIEITKAAGWLLNEHGWNVFSPITHSHPLHVLCPDVGADWQTWQKIDLEYIDCSRRIIVFRIPGWSKSIGVTAERKYAKKSGLAEYALTLERGVYRLSTVRSMSVDFYAKWPPAN